MRLFRYSKNYHTIFLINKVDKRVTHIDSHRLTSTHIDSHRLTQLRHKGIKGLEETKN